MKMKADPSHVMMSDALKGQVPVLDGEMSQAVNQHVVVIVEKLVGGETSAVVGVLRGVRFGLDPELEFKCELKEALDLMEANGLVIKRFELHHGQRVVTVPGPFNVKEARLDEIVPSDQLCTLGLHLAKCVR